MKHVPDLEEVGARHLQQWPVLVILGRIAAVTFKKGRASSISDGCAPPMCAVQQKSRFEWAMTFSFSGCASQNLTLLSRVKPEPMWVAAATSLTPVEDTPTTR